ncbi:MAG TPA: hypothetical protein VK780_06075 [Thermoanaerobaculia bacterium]|jgi:hypothetical protein|nr:hypothetical protein [Thermoanaerobaculia bacterium]
MPEYLFPGVYVEEMDSGVKQIPGVPTSIDRASLESLAADFRKAMQSSVPQWTDPAQSDPGITLLEVFGFVAEGLVFRAGDMPERGRAAARRAAAALAVLAQTCEPGGDSLKRPLFFNGQLLDAATFAAEQDYHREKLRRLNRAVLGYGVVTGLAVHIEPGDSGGGRVVVEPGYAIDRRGEQVSLPCRATLAVPAHGESAFVTVRLWEQTCAASPTAGGPPGGMPSVEEACLIGVSPAVLPPAFALARLVRSDGRWQVDPLFVTPRVLHRESGAP